MKKKKKERTEHTVTLRVSPTAAWEVAKAAKYIAKKTAGPTIRDIMISASPTAVSAATAATAATGGGVAAAGAVGSAFAGTAFGTACVVAAPAVAIGGLVYGITKLCKALWD